MTCNSIGVVLVAELLGGLVVVLRHGGDGLEVLVDRHRAHRVRVGGKTVQMQIVWEEGIGGVPPPHTVSIIFKSELLVRLADVGWHRRD